MQIVYGITKLINKEMSIQRLKKLFVVKLKFKWLKSLYYLSK